MTYDIHQMVPDRGLFRDRRIVLNEVTPSIAVEVELRQIIIGLLRAGQVEEAERLARAAKIDKSDLWRAAGAEPGSLTSTAVGRLRRVWGGLLVPVAKRFNDAFRDEEERHREEFTATARKALGVDLKALVAQPEVQPHIQLATRRNVALVKNLSDDVARRLENTLLQEITAGSTNRSIEKTISESFEFGKSRARLIARDQAAKFNGTLNRVRQTEAGIDKYQWSTSLDERVRSEHRVREGVTYNWSDSGPKPGEEIQCRCTARPIVEF